ELKEKLIATLKNVRMGSPEDFMNFMGAVIDKGAFETITQYIDYAKKSPEAEFINGGEYDDSKGYFIEPTIIQTTNPKFKLIEEEIFGPVLTVYVYPDDKYEETLHLCDETSPYALTGAFFATDRFEIIKASEILTHAAGNFYINDKPTGAVVGQQPFGGSRASGTNDKAGSLINLQRWVSPRTIKENFLPPLNFAYPHMKEK
ncbi:MAG TPA: aldehyde dehydrogenase family protein, partial [bacterium]